MNRENTLRWINSLRSGEYEQGIGSLRTIHDKYCCLGVACDEFAKATGRGEWELTTIHRDGARYSFVVDGESYTHFLPSVVMSWLGLDVGRNDIQLLVSDNDENSGEWASILNDDGNTFEFISDRIEKKLSKES